MNNDQLAAYVEKVTQDQTRGLRTYLDLRFKEIEDKVDPMHAYFTTAKTNLTIIKWLVGVVSAVVVGWQAFKEWLK